MVHILAMLGNNLMDVPLLSFFLFFVFGFPLVYQIFVKLYLVRTFDIYFHFYQLSIISDAYLFNFGPSYFPLFFSFFEYLLNVLFFFIFQYQMNDYQDHLLAV